MKLADSIAARIVLACTAVAVFAVAIVGLGVWWVGGEAFAKLMSTHGAAAADAHVMFDESVTQVLLIAMAVALVAAIVPALVLGERISRPLRAARRAAHQIARGEYQARVPRNGPDEVVDLADSFNAMGAALAEHERSQRDFIANAAHELVTPLTNLQGYLEALRGGVIKPEPQVFEALAGEVDRLVRLSSSLNQLSRSRPSSEMSVQDVDIAATLRSAAELAQPAAHTKRVSLAIEGDPVAVRADQDRLTQVVSNLLSNALDFTPYGGRIVLRCADRGADVLISVTNSGDGIPATDLPHIFERFYRVEKSRDRRHGGAGLGLAIVRQLVESAGGRVGAESANGLTTIWFTVKSTPG
jgi:signal transduction histidine kinase